MMSALREEIIGYIKFIPEDKLEAIKPLLSILSNEPVMLEKLTDENMSDEEREAFRIGELAYRNGECTDFEDYLKERISANL